MIFSNLKIKQLNILVFLLLVGLCGCQTSSTEEVSPGKVLDESRLDTQLVLNSAVLEQSNKQENTVWKIKANRIVYSEDKQIATLDQVTGNLWQGADIILKISAETGEIRENGNLILLNDQIVANDPRSDSVITSNAIEWRPHQNLLLIKDHFIGVNADLEVSANSGKYFTDTETLEFEGDVVAESDKASLQLTSDRLKWQISQALISSPNAIEIVRYDPQKIITDKLVSDRAEVNLETKIATLNQNIELVTSDPPLQIATNFLTWNYQERIGKTDQPIQILDRDRQFDLTGNQGKIDFQKSSTQLNHGVKGIDLESKTEIYANQLTWQINTEDIEAEGNVIYEQTNPRARLTGEKALGNLRQNKIVVTSKGEKQVTSVINN